MKVFVCIFLLVIALIFLPGVMPARHILRQHSHHSHHHSILPPTRDEEKVNPNTYKDRTRPVTMKYRGADPLQIAGSALPDCSHACGSCSPCRLVMVSFVCASLAEAETCPMAYKCMCKNKSYPVP